MRNNSIKAIIHDQFDINSINNNDQIIAHFNVLSKLSKHFEYTRIIVRTWMNERMSEWLRDRPDNMEDTKYLYLYLFLFDYELFNSIRCREIDKPIDRLLDSITGWTNCGNQDGEANNWIELNTPNRAPTLSNITSQNYLNCSADIYQNYSSKKVAT